MAALALLMEQSLEQNGAGGAEDEDDEHRG